MSKLANAVASILFIFAMGTELYGADPREITVLTYNIHHGEGMDGKLDLERIARVISSNKPDLVALQEVDQKTKRTGGVDQAAEIARLAGMKFVFGKAIDLGGGAYGQAVLSRWPITSHTVHLLPQKAGREQRIALLATIETPSGNLLFASTHLEHQVASIRENQARALNDIFARNHFSLGILAGDFNSAPDAAAMKLLFDQWTDTAGTNALPTIPSEKPSRRIDYILTRPAGRATAVKSQVPNEPIASDHRPVLATLHLAE